MDSNNPRAPLPNTFGIYLHSPFCIHRCGYCDFYSVTGGTRGELVDLTEALIREARAAREWLACWEPLPPARSVFWGGGTPSLIPVPSIARVLEAVAEIFPLEEDAEVTLEANPETVEPRFLEGLAATKVNRVSLGAQSFRPEHLVILERNAGPDTIARAALALRRHGFENFSLDLIFGIPGQTVEQMIEDIDRAVDLGPRHVSFYCLTLKPAHPLYARLPGPDLSAEMYERGIDRLKDHGLALYEISNFSVPGRESRHNLLYWDGGDFLGLGPSAASRFFRDGVFHHRKQFSDYHRYFERPAFPEPGFTASTRGQSVLEAVFLEMRKADGVSMTDFERRYGYALERAAKYPLFLAQRLIHREGDRLRLTERGRMLADSVTEELVD